MKRNLSFSFYGLLCTMLLLAGCTLYMDEPEPVPEEQRGIGEEYHEVNDTVDVTYEFQDGMRILSQRIQNDYLVQVVADSVLYFSETTPPDDLPLLGYGVFSQCTDKLPWGLCSTVTGISREGGFIKVTTRQAQLNDVFKKFVLKSDKVVDVNKARVIEGESTMEKLHSEEAEEEEEVPDENYNPDEFVPDDGSDPSFVIQPDEAAAREYAARRRAWGFDDDDMTTRADDDPSGNEDTEEKMTFGISFSTKYLSEIAKFGDKLDKATVLANMMKLPKVPSKLTGLLKTIGGKKKKFEFGNAFLQGALGEKGCWYATGDIQYENTITLHTIIDSEKDHVEFLKEETTTWSGGIEVGVDLGNEKETEPGKWLADKTLFKNNPKLALEQDVEGPDIVIPIFGPVSAVINTGFSVKFSVNAAGKVRFSRTTKKVTGTIVEGGKQTKVDRDESNKNESLLKEASLQGSAKIEAGFGVDVGLRIGRGISLDLTIGAEIKAGAEIKCYKNFVDLMKDYEHQEIGNENYINIFCKLGTYYRIRIKAFWFTAFDYKDDLPFQYIFFDEYFRLWPVVDDKATRVDYLADDQHVLLGDDGFEKTLENFNMQLQFKSKGLIGTLSDDMVPFVQIYDGRSDKRLDCHIIDDPLKAESPYSIDFEDMDNDHLYRAVPGIIYDDVAYEYPKSAIYFNSVSPYINLPDFPDEKAVTQVYGFNAGIGIVPCRYVTKVYASVYGSSMIKRWGLHVVVKSSTGKTWFNQRMVVHNERWNLYTIGLDFRTNLVNPTIEVTPFAYIYKDGSEAELKLFNSEKRTLKLSDDYGKLSDVDNLPIMLEMKK